MCSSVLIVCAAALLALTSAAPQLQQTQSTTPIAILRSAVDTKHDGNYAFSFETANSIVREEQSEVVNAGQPNEARVVRGRYAYVDPDGQSVEMRYFVDEEGGYHVEGNVLPQAPEIPPEIQAALARNAAEEAKLSEQERAEIETGRYVIH